MNVKYHKLLDYIGYFEDDTIEYCKWQSGGQSDEGVRYLPYPSYDPKLREFIQDVYDSDIMMDDYMPYFKDRFGNGNDAKQVIHETDNMDTLRAILTYYVRQERFHDGLWGQAAEDKIFLHILLKLKELQLK